MRLARQQQDFVSAVSHELKTPLTSIRMYGEMLKAGWADDAKRQTYYDYIHGESERLSRLIENVLQLSRLTRSSAALRSQGHHGRRAARPRALEGGDAGRARGLRARRAQRDARRTAVVVDADSLRRSSSISSTTRSSSRPPAPSSKVEHRGAARQRRRRAVHGARLRPGRAEGADEEDLRALLSRRERADARDGRHRHRACARAPARPRWARASTCATASPAPSSASSSRKPTSAR